MYNHNKPPIKLSKHAKYQAIARNVSSAEIKEVIYDPTETIYDEYHGNYKSYKMIGNEYLEVIHTKVNKHILVITVIWMARGGIRADGFSKV